MLQRSKISNSIERIRQEPVREVLRRLHGHIVAFFPNASTEAMALYRVLLGLGLLNFASLDFRGLTQYQAIEFEKQNHLGLAAYFPPAHWCLANPWTLGI